jgi:hypothetical protein
MGWATPGRKARHKQTRRSKAILCAQSQPCDGGLFTTSRIQPQKRCSRRIFSSMRNKIHPLPIALNLSTRRGKNRSARSIPICDPRFRGLAPLKATGRILAPVFNRRHQPLKDMTRAKFLRRSRKNKFLSSSCRKFTQFERSQRTWVPVNK